MAGSAFMPDKKPVTTTGSDRPKIARRADETPSPTISTGRLDKALARNRRPIIASIPHEKHTQFGIED